MFSKHDLSILAATIILSILGLVTLTSTSIGVNGDIELGGIVGKQIMFILVGYVLYFLLSRIDFSYLRHTQVSGFLYFGVIMLLIATLVWGPVINNVQRWLIIAGVQIQASEIAKLVIIICTASILSLKDRYNEWLIVLGSFLLVLPISTLIYLEPHGAMSLIMFILWFFLMFTFIDDQLRNGLMLLVISLMTGGIMSAALGRGIIGIMLIVASIVVFIFSFYARDHWRKLFIIAIGVGIALGLIGSVSWNNILKDYQKDRIEVFLNPKDVDDDKAFNVNQAKIAIGSGGLIGKGFGYGTQSRLQFLPEHQTDFIFATYAEQFGLLGSLFLLSIYAFIIIKVLVLGFTLKGDFFGSILAIGIGVKILLEVFINIGTNSGAIPATGIPLPLMSAGGSITLMTFVSLGLIQSIIASRKNHPQTSDLVDNTELFL